MWFLLACVDSPQGDPPVWSAPVAPVPTVSPEPPTPPGPPPPNVLLVVLDDVGTDKIAAYAEHPLPALTPNIDALAARGTLFRNAWAYTACTPTRAALITGRYG